ncbi:MULTISPECIES: hypothetical protein [Nostocales]|uniref:Uncharacterized protein n=3 Tax=Nostocales TaxID=1161 RepID=A0A8S9SVR0_9CYAN|nr:hypothetical protein [Tolypothrix bouteillei]KAF3884541.1 hypothetical protein DA73_0400002930 [Tolypothrix bouteillei VB521301]
MAKLKPTTHKTKNFSKDEAQGFSALARKAIAFCDRYYPSSYRLSISVMAGFTVFRLSR